ncbi:hypothetical protein FIU95_02940 [Microbulbifer sp. THAF38]|nr:hypothetical protein FIU95_02940 [Microbulbifer sp. THAF38]
MIPVYPRWAPVHDVYTVYGSVARVISSFLALPVYLYPSYVRARTHAITAAVFIFNSVFIFSLRVRGFCITGIREA